MSQTLHAMKPLFKLLLEHKGVRSKVTSLRLCPCCLEYLNVIMDLTTLASSHFFTRDAVNLLMRFLTTTFICSEENTSMCGLDFGNSRKH